MGFSKNNSKAWALLCYVVFIAIAYVAAVEAANGNSSSAGEFNVMQFGAIADGTTDNSEAFGAAWKAACEWKGPSRLLIPEGTFLVGPVLFKGPCPSASPMVVQVKGKVKALTDMSKYPSDEWIVFQYVDGLVVTGGGTFDGQGASAWRLNQCPKKAHCKLLPTSLKFNFITNGEIRGIHSVDSKLFHMLLFGCKNLNVQSIKISAPADSPNTDGIHVGSSSNITISRSHIGTGDDCISLGPGSTQVTVKNVFCGPGHGISVGSLGKFSKEEGVQGLHVENCTISDTTNGLRIKTWAGSDSSSASNFTYEDIVMNNVANPIIIDQQYCPYSSCPQKGPSRVKINDISFKNIRGTSASKIAVNLLCSEAFPCQNVQLDDIKLEYNGQGEASTASCTNVKGVSTGIQIPPTCI
ncbi:hypothetical protein AMTRI_Chr12g273480 [Amborella trichopoda]|uniref:Uncharacterized protein n=1 Tax=Amborella trichopoda TaxID=13333 RepID=W1PH95_AMBTC|nr:exopolygalacturonase [Amborella trichopoda]ERN07064.1 hypothetical protein AMTR_s00019p00055210 [Amborella trichopoda]|eukprot:XP_006845389.1 exopolygalacturonase [Amborella trichopoda]